MSENETPSPASAGKGVSKAVYAKAQMSDCDVTIRETRP